jgi:hypothetical protein
MRVEAGRYLSADGDGTKVSIATRIIQQLSNYRIPLETAVQTLAAIISPYPRGDMGKSITEAIKVSTDQRWAARSRQDGNPSIPV